MRIGRIAVVGAVAAATLGVLVAPAGAVAKVTAVTRVKAVAAPGAERITWSVPQGAAKDTVEIVESYDGSCPTSVKDGWNQTTVAARAKQWINTQPYGLQRYSVFTRSASGKLAPTHTCVHAPLTSTSKFTAFQILYVLPKGTAAKNRGAAIRHDIAVVNAWYKTQTNGHVHPRFVMTHGKPSIEVIHLPVTQKQLSSSKSGDGTAIVTRAIAQAGVPGDVATVDFVEGQSSVAGNCGIDGGANALLWMPACNIYPSTSDQWTNGATYLAAHEMTHAMGAVASCAPHSTKDGHVNDSPKDLLYSGPEDRDWAHLVLDYHHDDYYDNTNKKCPGITDDAVWTK